MLGNGLHRESLEMKCWLHSAPQRNPRRDNVDTVVGSKAYSLGVLCACVSDFPKAIQTRAKGKTRLVQGIVARRCKEGGAKTVKHVP